MINAKDKEQTYRTVPEGTYYYGLTLIDGEVYRVLMWNDLLSIEGTDRIVKMTFRLFDVTIKGSGLVQLIRDAKRHRIDILTVTPRHQSFSGGEGVVVTDLFVKEMQS
ncbi:MAG TPA: hypothetical protein VN841_13115 [Bryobacteraceae bacterium]|nr:hypothetical protein [Bryobacteraceae bacterium]